MVRIVNDREGRQWTLRSQLEWRQPATSDDFEHDVSASPTSAFVLLTLILILGVVLVVSIPEDVVAPWNSKMLWLGLLIVLAILFFPARWALRRPWTVVAEVGDNGEGRPVEKWTGTVRGVLAMRQEFTRAAKSIRDESQPGIEGLLQPVA